MKMNEFGKDWEKNISSVVSESVDLRIMKSLKKKEKVEHLIMKSFKHEVFQFWSRAIHPSW